MARAMSDQTMDFGRGLIGAAVECNARLLQIAWENLTANLDYAGKLARAASPSDFIDITSSHLRDRFETLSEQFEEIAALIERAEPPALREKESETATFFE